METLTALSNLHQETTAPLSSKNRSSLVYTLVAALACIVSALYIDAAHLQYHNLRPTTSFWVRLSRQITAEEFPPMSPLYLLRTLLLLAASALIVRSVFLFPNNKSTDGDRTFATEVLPFRGSIFPKHAQNLALVIVTTISLFFLILFLTDPVAFNSLCLEDHAVETYSDVLQFLNCGLFVYIWVLIRRSNIQRKRLYQTVAALFVVFFFLCAGEEVSWFQRVLNIKTPGAFASNIQYEMNLHNFATHPLENIYYFMSFAFLVFVPFVKERTRLLRESAIISVFTPGSLVLLFSVPFVAYNYFNLNVFATQLSVGITLFVLLDLVRTRYRQRSAFAWTTVIFLLFFATQVLFLVYGNRMVRNFDEKEYKEMLIPLSYLVFTMGVLRKVRRLKTTASAFNQPLGTVRIVRQLPKQDAV